MENVKIGWWMAAVAAVGAVIGWFVRKLFLRRLPPAHATPMMTAKAAVAAAEAEAAVKLVIAEKGKETALKAVDVKYAAQLKALDERQKTEALELRENPEKLAAYLVRVAGASEE